jgi:hypothetical protein
MHVQLKLKASEIKLVESLVVVTYHFGVFCDVKEITAYL